MKLTPKEYADGGGSLCPHCGSGELTGHSIEVNAGRAFQEIACNICEEAWYDVYDLVGYEEIE